MYVLTVFYLIADMHGRGKQGRSASSANNCFFLFANYFCAQTSYARVGALASREMCTILLLWLWNAYLVTDVHLLFTKCKFVLNIIRNFIAFKCFQLESNAISCNRIRTPLSEIVGLARLHARTLNCCCAATLKFSLSVCLGAVQLSRSLLIIIILCSCCCCCCYIS